MARSKSHKRAQRRAAGKHGYTEVPLPSGRFLDALTSGGGRATEVERSGKYNRLLNAADRLREAGTPQKVLVVPHNDIDLAVEAMREVGITGTVKNITGSKKKRVRW